MNLDKNIPFTLTTLESFKGKHFSRLTFSYFGDEPVEKLAKIEDNGEKIILGFSKDKIDQKTSRKSTFFIKHDNII